MKDHLISTCGEKCFFLRVRRLLCNCSYEYRIRVCHCKMNNDMSFLQFMAKDDSTYSAIFSKDNLENILMKMKQH